MALQACTAAAALLLGLAAASAAECAGDGTCSNDANSLLQVNLNVGKALEGQAPAPPPAGPASFLDDTGFMCIEADEASILYMITFHRAGPFNQFAAHTPMVKDTCASQGYTQAFQSPDSCFGTFGAYGGLNGTSYLKPGTTSAQISAFGTRVQGLITAQIQARNLTTQLGMKWATCYTCLGGVPGAGGSRWWMPASQTQSYDIVKDCGFPDFKTLNAEIMTATRSSSPQIGAFVASARVCFEGPYQYMVDTLAMVKRTPMEPMFQNQVVQQKTCLDLGYDKVRDPIDECWPMASKNMNSTTEQTDIIGWIAGPTSMPGIMQTKDLMGFLPPGTAVELASCFGCQAGGAARDRGMTATQDPTGANGFTAHKCEKLLKKACNQWASKNLLAADLCTAGLANFSAVFHAKPLQAVPVISTTSR